MKNTIKTLTILAVLAQGTAVFADTVTIFAGKNSYRISGLACNGNVTPNAPLTCTYTPASPENPKGIAGGTPLFAINDTCQVLVGGEHKLTTQPVGCFGFSYDRMANRIGLE